MASEKENVSNGTEGREQGLHQHTEDAVSHPWAKCPPDPPQRAVVCKAARPLSSKDNVSGGPEPLGDESYLTPVRVKGEEKSCCGFSEKQRGKNVDFATVTTADFGITPERFVNGSTAKSPAALKLRRRSAIGARGSPENNALIQYLAQQKSNRQKEDFTQQASPFQYARSLKSKMDIFQTTFKSAQGAEGKRSSSGLSQASDASQEDGCAARKKAPVTKEHSQGQKSEAFVSDCNAADLKENVKQNLSDGKKSAGRVCTILSLQHDLPELAAVSKERTCKQDNPTEFSEAVRDILETIHGFSSDRISKEVRSNVVSDQSRKKVNFAEELIVEVYDESKPPVTPLQIRNTSLTESTQSGSQLRSVLKKTPVKQPMDCVQECIEPLQELQEVSASEELSPVENTKGAETDTKTTRSSTKRKYRTISEGTDCSISRTTSTENAKDTKNPRKNELQRPKSVTIPAAKKKQKTKRGSFGKRRKRKVKKSLYGEREMASKKPLLSPILEIPEVFSSASSPNSPKANGHFPDDSICKDVHKDVQQKQVTERTREKTIPVVPVYPSSKDLDIVEGSSSNNPVFQFPDVVPDTNDVLDTYDCSQQTEETACLKEKTESDFLIENEKLQRGFPRKEEWLTGLEFPNQKDTDACEILQRAECPPKRSSRGRPPRRSSSNVYIPPIEKFHFEATGDDLQVSSFNVEEVLSAPRLKNNSVKGPFRRKSSMSSETSRVRRSMRLHKDAKIEGLAWIEVTNEILQDPPLLSSACRTRRTISTSALRESENVHHGEENLVPFAASGKENSEPVDVAGGPCKRKRKSICVSTPQETRTWSQTRKRSMTNSVYNKEGRNQIHSEEMKINNVAT
ncbi:hypothetical protein ASZ78_002528 [Callipepla squamata]|uniref:PP1-binding domain-containing protein n=1 Tax=Callipepla squamata TaxID=9009 RepID=A0A226ML96_CALSU|nr:hypothetical protein ASZ78_002528 [Callipepla squamata]